MADHFSLTQKWLRQNIQPYSRSDLVYSHVDAVLTAYLTLRPKTDVYTFDDGRSQLLLCIHGLLPIAYRRASYNIPIAVWLTHEYPMQPPLVYVVPTSDMLVKAGKFVDVSGRCEPAYIIAWRKKSEGCNLRALLEALTEQFSREPPVYAKPKTTTTPPRPRDGTPSTSQTSDYSSRPPPVAPNPQQTQANGFSPSPSPSRASLARPMPNPDSFNGPPTHSPPPPPQVSRYSHIPGQNVYHPPRPATSSNLAQDPPTYTTPPAPRQPPPPPPPDVHTRRSSVTHVSPPPQGPLPSHPPFDPATPIQQRWSMPPGNVVIPGGSPPAPGPPHQSIPMQHPHHPAPIHVASFAPPLPPPQPPIPPTPSRNFLEEEDDDAQPAAPTNAPPRPPNPEILRLHAQVHAKFAAEFTAFDQALATDVQRLRTAQSDLLAGEPAIRDEMARLEAVRDVCRVVAGRSRTTVDGAEANLSELRRKGDPEVDELICSTTIVYNQLIDLVAEDNAIEDTVYHLHRALNAGRIDLDKFIRTTRALAEEQFMKRALAEKIVTSIPLGAWT